jgi:hypothetical protein
MSCFTYLLRGCGVAQTGRVRRTSDGGALAGPSSILSSAPQGVFLTELTSDEKIERNLSEWRQMNVLYECDGLENIKY